MPSTAICRPHDEELIFDLIGHVLEGEDAVATGDFRELDELT